MSGTSITSAGNKGCVYGINFLGNMTCLRVMTTGLLILCLMEDDVLRRIMAESDD